MVGDVVTIRGWIGKRLRFLADRIDYKGAPRYLGYSVTIETGESVPRIREDGRGCKLWYLGDAEYEKAHTEADSAEEDARRDERRRLIEIALGSDDTDEVAEAMKQLNWSVSP